MFIHKSKVCWTAVLVGGMLLCNVPASAQIVEDKNNIGSVVYSSLTPYMKSRVDAYSIHISSKPINSISLYSSVPSATEGAINYRNKEIYITINTNGHRTTQHTLYHELGHVLEEADYKSSIAESSECDFKTVPEFLTAFYKESKSISILSDEVFFTSRADEYFAESVAIYKEQPKLMKVLAPLTYNFIDKAVNKQLTNSI